MFVVREVIPTHRQLELDVDVPRVTPPSGHLRVGQTSLDWVERLDG